MFQSINPYTKKLLSTYEVFDQEKIALTIERSDRAFRKWKQNSIQERAGFLKTLALELRHKKPELAILITSEMGKIISESQAEIEKCAWLCDYYAEHASEMLEEKGMPSDGTVSYIRFEPLGVIYAIMPWNFPFWQVLRFAIPTITTGNTVVLKHAPNVFGCALAIENLFTEAGFPKGVFSNLFITVEQSDQVISNPLIQGVTLTGSQKAGRSVAAAAGKHLKKTVMELGGSDPLIVLGDADLKKACQTGTASRMLNSGQVCIAAKRFIVEESIHDQFVEEHKFLMEQLKSGDPMDAGTNLGPIARTDLIDTIERQVRETVRLGAHLITGGKRINNNFYAPTLLTGVKKGMPACDEEIFGPVSVVIPAKDYHDAVRIANDTPFGLGASVWTQNLEVAEEMALKIEAGSVFINGMTKSDPRLPFGGIKQSGYGRELSLCGLLEFTNIKTVWIS